MTEIAFGRNDRRNARLWKETRPYHAITPGIKDGGPRPEHFKPTGNVSRLIDATGRYAVWFFELKEDCRRFLIQYPIGKPLQSWAIVDPTEPHEPAKGRIKDHLLILASALLAPRDRLSRLKVGPQDVHNLVLLAQEYNLPHGGLDTVDQVAMILQAMCGIKDISSAVDRS